MKIFIKFKFLFFDTFYLRYRVQYFLYIIYTVLYSTVRMRFIKKITHPTPQYCTVLAQYKIYLLKII